LWLRCLRWQKHLAETEMQLKRLDEIFRVLGEDPKGDTSEPMIGLAADGQEVMHSKGDANVLDAALIGAAQKIEHYEIAVYGTLIAYAKLLGENRAAKLLKMSLAEEKATDRRLSELAEKMVNRKAVYAYPQGKSDKYFEYHEGGLSFGAILLGALAGVAAGMLLAPSTGDDTRRKLVEGATSLWDQWGGKVGNLADAARSTYNKVVGQPQETNGNGGHVG
jgi:ferritin-like metal-binding protein YciE